MIKIFFNNKPISTWKLYTLKGTLNALTTPAKSKSFVSNDSNCIDGSIVLNVPRRVQKRDLSIPFMMKASSLIEINQLIAALENELTTNNEVEVYVPDVGVTYYLKYKDIDKYNNFSTNGHVTLYLQFTEFNPKRRIYD